MENRKNFYDALNQLAKRNGKTDEYVIMQFLLSKSIKGAYKTVENKKTGCELVEGEYQISFRDLAIAIDVPFKSVRTTIKNLIKQELLSYRIEKGICIFKLNFNVKVGTVKNVYSNKLHRKRAQQHEKRAQQIKKAGTAKLPVKVNKINELDSSEKQKRAQQIKKAGTPIYINNSGYIPFNSGTKAKAKDKEGVTGISTREKLEDEVELKIPQTETKTEDEIHSEDKENLIEYLHSVRFKIQKDLDFNYVKLQIESGKYNSTRQVDNYISNLD